MRSILSLKMLVLAAALALGFGLLAILALFHLNAIRIDAQLRSVARDAVGRVERTVDLAIMAMLEQSSSGGLACDAAGRVSMREAFYAVGNIKDLKYSGKGESCWAWSENVQELHRVVDHAKYVPALNADYELAAIALPNWRSLVLKWKPDEGSSLAAVLSTNHLLFDVLPAQLRDDVVAKLALSDGAVFTEYAPSADYSIESDNQTHFNIVSDRFPIVLSISLGNSAYWTSFYQTPTEVIAAIVVLSLLFGVLSAKGAGKINRPEDELREAIKKGELKPFFQPLFNLETRDLIGFEMLARWIKPGGKMVSPSVFIPIAENGALIDSLLSSLLRQAGRDLGTVLRKNPHLKLTFNVTPDQFLATDFKKRLQHEVEQAGLPTHCLVVEVTERQAFGDLDQASVVAKSLSEAGIRLAIDDAGTGHNGLSSMHALSAHIIKIDKYFVDGVTFNRKSRAMIEMLVSFASEFGMEVVAEGIESEEQLSVLCTLGIAQGQGYLYAKPMPASELMPLIANNGLRSMKTQEIRANLTKVEALA